MRKAPCDCVLSLEKLTKVLAPVLGEYPAHFLTALSTVASVTDINTKHVRKVEEALKRAEAVFLNIAIRCCQQKNFRHKGAPRLRLLRRNRNGICSPFSICLVAKPVHVALKMGIPICDEIMVLRIAVA
mmetsp:Transcript_11654/g.37102  ORF Transcript_11654/g.37102 Transcript_11654/m.37102 type:complete len:129 (+) Transcript_11654:416-802(+)